MQLTLPCPSCHWLEIIHKKTKPTTFDLHVDARCLKCGWEGTYIIPCSVITKREGSYERD